jgi:hypothetical protein
VNLKHVLRQTDSDRRNLHGGRSRVADATSTLAHRCRYRWGRPSHCLRTSCPFGIELPPSGSAARFFKLGLCSFLF